MRLCVCQEPGARQDAVRSQSKGKQWEAVDAPPMLVQPQAPDEATMWRQG